MFVNGTVWSPMWWIESLTLVIFHTDGVIHVFREWHEFSKVKAVGLSEVFHTEDNDLDLVNELK